MMGRTVTLEDVNAAQNGRIIGDIPLSDPYWRIVNQYRSQEELTMEQQKEVEAITGAFSSGPTPEGIETLPKVAEEVANQVAGAEQHDDVDPNALEQEEEDEFGDDDEDENGEENGDEDEEDEDLDDTVDELKENEDFAQDNVPDRNEEV